MSNNRPLIYKITSPKNRVYIGQSINFKSRVKSYKGLRCESQPRLYLSLKKYGFKNHTIEIIEYCNESELNNRERYWQDLYDVLSKKGLNCRLTASDDRSGKFSDSTIRKMKSKDITYMIGNNFRTGIKHSEEIKEQIRNTLIENSKKEDYVNPMSGKFGHLNPFFGRKHSNQTKEILRNNALKNKRILDIFNKCNKDRQHLLLDTQTGIYYESISEASELLCINKSSLKAMLSGRFNNKTNLIKV